MVQDRELAAGAGCRVRSSDAPVEHEHAERHVAEQGAALGGLERALPAICLELADVVEQRARDARSRASARQTLAMARPMAATSQVCRSSPPSSAWCPACWRDTARSARGSPCRHKTGRACDGAAGPRSRPASDRGRPSRGRRRDRRKEAGASRPRRGAGPGSKLTLSWRLPLYWPTSPLTCATTPRSMPARRG